LASKIKAIDQNIATHAPRPVLKAIYRNLQRLICARMKAARICTATHEWDNDREIHIGSAEQERSVDLENLLPANLNVDLALRTLRLLAT
jgi:hypothetical protein